MASGPRLLGASAVMLVVALTAHIGRAAPTVETAAPAGEPSSVAGAAATPSDPSAEREVSPPMPAQPDRRPTLGISAGSVHDLDRFIAATGTHPEVFDVFEQWSRNRPLDRAFVEDVARRNARLSITWEPWDPDGSHTDQADFTLASVIRGEHDAYIDMYATSLKDLPYVITIRLMHEMNGNWYPWGVRTNGNDVRQFVLAWRHVHDRFTALGVTNVEWLWAPNAVYPGAAPLAPLYPGDAYADAVGISNYNWGDHSHDGFATSWESFGSLFTASLAELQSLTGRPVWISEVGSSNAGGSKAAWLRAMLGELTGRPEIAGLIWFDHRDERAGVDWRIETEPDAADAWRAVFDGRPARR